MIAELPYTNPVAVMATVPALSYAASFAVKPLHTPSSTHPNAFFIPPPPLSSFPRLLRRRSGRTPTPTPVVASGKVLLRSVPVTCSTKRLRELKSAN